LLEFALDCVWIDTDEISAGNLFPISDYLADQSDGGGYLAPVLGRIRSCALQKTRHSQRNFHFQFKEIANSSARLSLAFKVGILKKYSLTLILGIYRLCFAEVITNSSRNLLI
jgi:hypothetical protein